MNEAAGTADACGVHGDGPFAFSAIALVTEKGDLCDHTIQRMREDLVRRNYAESTIRSYLHTLEDFRRYAQKRLDHLGPDDIRRYQVYLREERKLEIGTASNYVPPSVFFT